MKLHAFHTGGEIAPWSLIDPFHPKIGQTFTVPFHVFLIQHDKGNVLFDLGAHPDLAHDPRARLGAAARALVESNRGARERSLRAIAELLPAGRSDRGVVRPFRPAH